MEEDVVAEDVGAEPLGQFVWMLVLLLVLLLRERVELRHRVGVARRHHKHTCIKISSQKIHEKSLYKPSVFFAIHAS